MKATVHRAPVSERARWPRAAAWSLSCSALLAAGCIAAPRGGGWQEPAVPLPAAMPRPAPIGAAVQDGTGAQMGTQAPDGAAALPVELVAETGSLTVRVRWPDYRTQLLPLATARLRIAVSAAGGAVVGRAELVRHAGQSETATIRKIPAGQVTVSAEALAEDGTVLAAGSRTLTLLANTKATLALTLTSARPPAIADFAPKAGGPGTQVNVTGTNLGSSGGSYAIKVGGVAVAPGDIQSFGAGTLVFFVPEGATTDVITVTVDGIATASLSPFTTVGSLSLAVPSLAALATGRAREYAVTAFDTGGATVSAGAPVAWRLSNVTGVNPPAAGEYGFKVLGTFSPSDGTTNAAGAATASFTAAATGSGWVNVASGRTVKATASVSVE